MIGNALKMTGIFKLEYIKKELIVLVDFFNANINP